MMALVIGVLASLDALNLEFPEVEGAVRMGLSLGEPRAL